MKTFEYRLFTNKQQHALLMHCLRESRLIYNEMLEVTKQHYEEQGTFPTKYDLRPCLRATAVNTCQPRPYKCLL